MLQSLLRTVLSVTQFVIFYRRPPRGPPRPLPRPRPLPPRAPPPRPRAAAATEFMYKILQNVQLRNTVPTCMDGIDINLCFGTVHF